MLPTSCQVWEKRCTLLWIQVRSGLRPLLWISSSHSAYSEGPAREFSSNNQVPHRAPSYLGPTVLLVPSTGLTGLDKKFCYGIGNYISTEARSDTEVVTKS